MDMLEEKGVCGPAEPTKPQMCLLMKWKLTFLKAFEARDAAEDGF